MATDSDINACAFCEAEIERQRPGGHPGLVLLFAAVMPPERMREVLCKSHQAALRFIQAAAIVASGGGR